MRRLSPKMAHILKLMVHGWALGHNTTLDGRSWIQKGGLGHGGETADIHASTFLALYDRGLIYRDIYSCPTSTYRLTTKGRKIAEVL